MNVTYQECFFVTSIAYASDYFFFIETGLAPPAWLLILLNMLNIRRVYIINCWPTI